MARDKLLYVISEVDSTDENDSDNPDICIAHLSEQDIAEIKARMEALGNLPVVPTVVYYEWPSVSFASMERMTERAVAVVNRSEPARHDDESWFYWGLSFPIPDDVPPAEGFQIGIFPRDNTFMFRCYNDWDTGTTWWSSKDFKLNEVERFLEKKNG